jgi:tetraacyldisaccharide 4'-kinase
LFHNNYHILDVRTEAKHPLSYLKGKAVVALSGLGDPVSFEGQLESLGATLSQRWRYPDHHAYIDKELHSIEALRGGLPLVTTFKDFVRLPDKWRQILSKEILVLGIKLDIVKGRNIWIDTLDALAKTATEGQ